MPAIPKRINNSSDDNSDTNTAYKNPLVGNKFIELSVSSNEFRSKHHVSYNQLQEFWCGLTQQARKKLMRIDKQTLFEHARKNMYCSRCNGLLLEGFLHIVMYGKSIQQDVSSDHYTIGVSKQERNLCTENGCKDDAYDPSVHPWGGLTTVRDGTLTLLDYYLYSTSLNVVQNVFDSARDRERERELLYPDACGGDSRGWTSQGTAGYGRGHGTRETCALHTAQLSVETLEDFWSALGEETRHSLMKMKEEDFIERLMYRFDSKRFCRDCRRNVIREFKQLKELKRMRKEPRCSSWFCAADTAFQYEVSHDIVQADWHQTFSDSLGTYHYFEWAIGTGEGKSDILEFENVGLSVKVKVNGLDLSDLNACYITLRAWKKDGRCNELCVKAHALQGQHCVHCRLVVGDGFITITRGESIRRFFEHAEEAEEEEDDDSMDKDGNEFEGECSRPQKHAKSPELAREFLLDAATVIFKEQVEKAFREGTARQNAHSMFVSLALGLLEELLHVACKDIFTLEKQMKLLEEEEKEKRDEEVQKQRRERKRTKEREKKLRRKERLREKEKNENECVEESSLVIDDSSVKDLTGDDVSSDVVGSRYSTGEASPPLSASDIKEDDDDDQLLLLAEEEEYIYSNMEENMDGEFGHTRNNNNNISFSYDDHYHHHSRRKLRFTQPDWNLRKYNRAADGFESTRTTDNKQLSRVAAGPKLTGDRCQCPPSKRVVGGIKYDSHSYSSSSSHHHNEHHNKPSPESRIARLVRYHPKYTTNKKLESSATSSSSDNTPKPYYRANNKYNTQVEAATRDNSGGGRPKSKIIFGNHVKKVWEQLDSQKRYVRSNSDSDITLRSKPPRVVVVEDSESYQLPHDQLMMTDTISDSINNHVDTECSSGAGNGLLHELKNSQKYSKRAVSEDGELLTLVDSSISTSSNCSSCLSEGDSNNSSPNHLELASASSDSEEEDSVQNSSEVKNTNKGKNDAAADAANKIEENDSARTTKTTTVSSDNLPTEAAAPRPRIENGGNVATSSSSIGAPPQSMLPQMHNNQSIHYPVFHHAPPIMGYYHHHHHQTPVSWPVGPTNGLMSLPPPHSNHYLFANSFGYGLNGNAAACLMQFGALQHLPPPLLNTATHLPVFQPAVTHINGVSSKEEESKFGGGNVVAGELKEVQCNVRKEPNDAEKLHITNNKMDNGNSNGFSLFHFSGPVALSTGFEADPYALREGDVSPKKDSIEEYNLFAASNGIKFSFF